MRLRVRHAVHARFDGQQCPINGTRTAFCAAVRVQHNKELGMKKLNLNILLVSSLLALSACSTTGDGRLNANDKQEVINAAKKQTEAAKTAAEAAAAKVHEAQKAVEAATAKAEAMTREAEAAKTAAETAKAGAEAMKREAEKAKTAAETAKREAEAMKREAEAAKREVAERASSNLADVAAKAKQAQEAAKDAQEAAKEAKRLADKAKIEADNAVKAKSLAEEAQKAAKTAEVAAKKAQEEATKAKNQADLAATEAKLAAAQAKANGNGVTPKPEEPKAPKPEEPKAPKPEEPKAPKPEEPKAPNKPEEPKTPNKPEEPKTPNKPEEPKVPNKPEEPKTPNKPEEPKAPKPDTSNGGGTSTAPGAPATRTERLVSELKKTFVETPAGTAPDATKLQGGVFAVTHANHETAAKPVDSSRIDRIKIGDKTIRLLGNDDAGVTGRKVYARDITSGKHTGNGFIGRGKLGENEGSVRWGVYSDNGVGTLFVQGKETPVAELPSLKYNYAGDSTTTYKGSGEYRNPFSFDPNDKSARAVVDFANKRLDVSIKPQLDWKDADNPDLPKVLEFGADIKGNTFYGDEKGIISQGGFFGKNAATAVGVFFGKEGEKYDGWNGAFGVHQGDQVQ